MVKSKYSLSPEGVDRLMETLSKIAQEEADESTSILMEAKVSTDFVEKITKVQGITDVIDRNDELSKTYNGFLSLYGFGSMYDMYMYALSCDQIEEVITKGKDYSKLVPVKRKIMRNGKETEVTVYTDPNKDNPDDEDSKASGDGKKRTGAKHARELKGAHISDKAAADPKTIGKLKDLATKLPQGKNSFSDTSDHYLVLQDEHRDVTAIIGYSEKGQFMVMDFYRVNGEVPGQAARGFVELVQLARKKGMGVQAEDDVQARAVYAKCGLTHKDGKWSATSQELKAAFGESGGENG